MSKLAEETVHAQLGPGPLQTGPDGLISHCIAHALYRQAPDNDVVWDFTVNFSPNIIRPTTCVCASVCVADVSNLNKPSVLADPKICPQVFSVTCLPDQMFTYAPRSHVKHDDSQYKLDFRLWKTHGHSALNPRAGLTV